MSEITMRTSAASLSVAGCSDATPPMRSAGNRAGRHCAFPACHTACSRRAASSPPALWPLIIAAAPGRIVETPATPAEPDAHIGRARTVHDATLRLVVQRNDEFGAIVGLTVQRLVRNDERGPRQCGWRDAIEHILRDGDAVKRGLGGVPAVDRDRGPAQARGGARHGRKHMRADRLVGIADRDRNLNGRIEHLALVRQRLMRVTPHVKLLGRAADEYRDRRARQPWLAWRPARHGAPAPAPLLGRLA